MKFVSTRNRNINVNAAEAILRGLAPDGGLYIPDELPSFSPEEIRALGAVPYAEAAARVLERFLPGFTAQELREYAEGAYASFDDAAVAPMKELYGRTWVLELFHGPTCAFKDFALQMLPYLMAASTEKLGNKKTVAILVATSGDTGKAALEGFAGVKGTKIGVFYPDGGVSPIQRLQMVTQTGDNVFVSAVNGNFDDAQTGVKDIFSDSGFAAELEAKSVILSSANSINWGRLAPQIAYYYISYARLLCAGKIAEGEKVSFSVPTGNFGDILAGYLAKKSGLPVDKLICASNSNDVLTDFLRTGVYDRNRLFHLTMSPSMDILISSNLERLLFLLSGDDRFVAGKMAELKTSGRYDIGADMLGRLRDEGFAGFSADEAETASTIRRIWEREGYAADPHTAVGLSAAHQYRTETEDRKTVIALSTASPFKFAVSMLRSLGGSEPGDGFAELRELSSVIGKPIPKALGELESREVHFPGTVAKENMKSAVRGWLTK